MKIAVNARFLLHNKLEGLGRFSDEVLKRLTTNHLEHEFVFYFDRKFNERFIYADNIIPFVVHPQARHPYLYTVWFDYALPFCFKKHKPDLFLSPDGFLSLNSNIPALPVVHDLAFEHYPQFLNRTGANYYKKNFPKFCRKANRIATVSKYTKKDIINLYGIEPSKIDVVYNGVSDSFKPIDKQKQAKIREQYSSGKPFFVYVGSMHPRKNIVNMLRAFDEFKSNDILNFKLVVVGRKAWQTEAIELAFSEMKSKEDVIFTDVLSDTILAQIVASARALLYVPFFEGFGLPIIEAYACGVPSITSNKSSMPEVAGDAALLVDPEQTNSISEALQKMACNDSLHQLLAERALMRKDCFTWDKTAELLWQSILKVHEKNLGI